VLVKGRYDIGSLHRYIATLSSSIVVIQARMHLVSCGWRIRKDYTKIFYVSPENSITRKLVDVCITELENKQMSKKIKKT
jgi:hypothetical protein